MVNVESTLSSQIATFIQFYFYGSEQACYDFIYKCGQVSAFLQAMETHGEVNAKLRGYQSNTYRILIWFVLENFVYDIYLLIWHL